MADHSSPQGPNVTVALLVADAVDHVPLIETIKDGFSSSKTPVRALVRVVNPDGFSFSRALREAGVATDILVSSTITVPDDVGPVTCMPPGSADEEMNELALALSDVVIVPPGAVRDHASVGDLLSAARKLNKLICPPGCPLPCVPPLGRSLSHRLDPQTHFWPARGRSFFGRIEQTVLELLAFGWHGCRRSGDRIKKNIGKGWVPSSYFGPANWSQLCPDKAATSADAHLVKEFDRLDRSALFGSYVHRDLIWITYIFAGFAVLAAVLGSLFEPGSVASILSMIGELILLVLVGSLISWARYFRLQDRWTACRLGAEQLRVARMCLPLLVVPPALTSMDEGRDDTYGGKFNLTAQVLLEIRRAVRNHGLPHLGSDYSAQKAARWLKLIVDDQTIYHHRNRNKIECAECRLIFIVRFVFVASVTAVIFHFFYHEHWLLLFTAAGPAFAAALHGAETRLGITHRAGLSREVHRDLKRIGAALDAFLTGPEAATRSPAAAWNQVRDLALSAAAAMGQENGSWHRLVRRERDDIPA